MITQFGLLLFDVQKSIMNPSLPFSPIFMIYTVQSFTEGYIDIVNVKSACGIEHRGLASPHASVLRVCFSDSYRTWDNLSSDPTNPVIWRPSFGYPINISTDLTLCCTSDCPYKLNIVADNVTLTCLLVNCAGPSRWDVPSAMTYTVHTRIARDRQLETKRSRQFLCSKLIYKFTYSIPFCCDFQSIIGDLIETFSPRKGIIGIDIVPVFSWAAIPILRSTIAATLGEKLVGKKCHQNEKQKGTVNSLTHFLWMRHTLQIEVSLPFKQAQNFLPM